MTSAKALLKERLQYDIRTDVMLDDRYLVRFQKRRKAHPESRPRYKYRVLDTFCEHPEHEHTFPGDSQPTLIPYSSHQGKRDNGCGYRKVFNTECVATKPSEVIEHAREELKLYLQRKAA